MSNLPLRRPVLAGLVILAVVASACGGSAASPAPTAAPSAEATIAATPAATPAASAEASPSSAAVDEPQTGHIVLADKGFGVTLPDGWESLPVDAAALQAIIDGLPEGSDLRGVLESQVGSGALQQIAFWAFDVRPDSGIPGMTRNMNVIVQPASTFDLSLVESSVKTQLGTIDGIGTIESQVVTLPAGDALRLDYGIDIADASGATTSVSTTQYYVQLPDATLIISFTSEPGATDAAVDFDAIIRSLEAAS